jgi:hypothetical protein
VKQISKVRDTKAFSLLLLEEMPMSPTRLALLMLAAQATGESATHKKPRLQQVHAFTLGNTLNGGLVGALGPSISTFQASTGLDQGALARTIMLNRAAKLCGTFMWAFYAERLQRRKEMYGITPKRLLTAVTAIEVLCALSIVGFRSSAFVLQAALIVFGWCYGFTDSGFSLVTVWAERGDPKGMRTQVAMLNAGFTAGAVLTPAVISLALRRGGTSYPCFVVLALLAAFSGMTLAACQVLPGGAPPKQQLAEGRDEGRDEGREKGRDEGRDEAMAREGAPPAATSDAAVSPPGPPRGAGITWRGHLIVSCMLTCLFCATGTEHAVGTWLPTLGTAYGGISPATMATMSSFFWATICAGRVGWWVLSQLITSAWPVLFLDGLAMLLAGVLFALYSPARGPGLLWSACLLLGLGCASSLPCALTMPAEASLTLTPAMLTALNLAGTLGEMLAPYCIGLLLQRGWYQSVGLAVVAMMVALMSATAVAWAAAATAGSHAAAPSRLAADVVVPTADEGAAAAAAAAAARNDDHDDLQRGQREHLPTVPIPGPIRPHSIRTPSQADVRLRFFLFRVSGRY